MAEPQGRRLAAVMFSDMVGFTAAMQDNEQVALTNRDRYRTVVEHQHQKYGGEIVQYYGDGTLSIFSNSVDAVRCAIGIQGELCQEPEVPVRVGLHVGDVVVEAHGLLGDAVNVASRVESFGRPGAVLVSDSVHDLVKNQPDLTLVSLGQFHLDNVARPFELFAVDADGLTVPETDALEGKGRPVVAAALSNLPRRITSFIGREAEIARVQDLIAKQRLVTLTGTGGIGKTSLALEAATESINRFADGVWLVELAPLTDGLQVAATVGSILGCSGARSGEATTAVLRHLGDRQTLLILDNCEHLIGEVAKFTEAVLAGTNRVTVLATSREALRIGGETPFRVPSLEVPEADSAPEDLPDSSAVRLFVDRARLARPDFQIDGDAKAIAEISRHLDGIPLAIELAAARIDTMTPAQIADHLSDRFRLLTRGSRTLPRQQTLEALLDWSHELLADAEEVLLRRLGVFGPSFTAEGAARVGGFDPLDPPTIRDLLERLVDMSLVLAPEPGTDRYRMLETVRAYARRHLDQTGETASTMRRLVDFLLEAGPPSELGRATDNWIEWVQWRAAEIDNYRAAMDWARREKEGSLLGRLAVEVPTYLAQEGSIDEIDAWTDAALELLPDEPSLLRVRLLFLRANSCVMFGGEVDRPRDLLVLLRHDAEALDDQPSLTAALILEARIALTGGDLHECIARSEEAADGLGDQRRTTLWNVLDHWIWALLSLGRVEEAEARVALLDELVGASGDPADQSLRHSLRSWVALWRGDYDRCLEETKAGIEVIADIGDKCWNYLSLGRAQFCAGEFEAARESMREGFSMLPNRDYSGAFEYEAYAGLSELRVGHPQSAVENLKRALGGDLGRPISVERPLVLQAVADWALVAGYLEEAAVLLAASETARSQVEGLVPSHWEAANQKRLEDQLGGAFESTRLRSLKDEGTQMSYEQAAELARATLKLLDDV